MAVPVKLVRDAKVSINRVINPREDKTKIQLEIRDEQGQKMVVVEMEPHVFATVVTGLSEQQATATWTVERLGMIRETKIVKCMTREEVDWHVKHTDWEEIDGYFGNYNHSELIDGVTWYKVRFERWVKDERD